MIRNRRLTKQLSLLLVSVLLGSCAYAAEPVSTLSEDEIDPETELATDVKSPDAAAEKKSPAKRGITSFTQRFRKSREKQEPKSYIEITNDYVNTSGASDLEVGKEPTPEQLKNLKEDMVWIKQEEIGGYTINYPVVYIAEDYNQSTEVNKTENPPEGKK